MLQYYVHSNAGLYDSPRLNERSNRSNTFKLALAQRSSGGGMLWAGSPEIVPRNHFAVIVPPLLGELFSSIQRSIGTMSRLAFG